MKKYPYTEYEYHQQQITGTTTYRVLRFKLLVTGPKKSDRQLLKKSTVLDHAGKRECETYIIRKEKGFK